MKDPVRFCVLTTVALLAWALTPPVMVAIMAGAGLWAYLGARRRGLLQSRCVLGDTRLVIGYLGLAFLLGIAITIRDVLSTAGR
jgi:hypothetical protein